MMNNKIHECSVFGKRTVLCLFCHESAAISILMMMNPLVYGKVTSEVIGFLQVSVLWEHTHIQIIIITLFTNVIFYR